MQPLHATFLITAPPAGTSCSAAHARYLIQDEIKKVIENEKTLLSIRLIIPSSEPLNVVAALYALLLNECSSMPLLRVFVQRGELRSNTGISSVHCYPTEHNSIWRPQICEKSLIADLSSFRSAETEQPKDDGTPRVVAFGGSFDNPHAGHVLALEYVCEFAMQAATHSGIVLGLCEDLVVFKKPGSGQVLRFESRRAALQNLISSLLNLRGFELMDEQAADRSGTFKEKIFGTAAARYEAAALHFLNAQSNSWISLLITSLGADGVGVAGNTPEIRWLLLTPETLQGGERVNLVRKNNGLYPLKTLVCPLMEANPYTPRNTSRASTNEGDANACDEKFIRSLKEKSTRGEVFVPQADLRVHSDSEFETKDETRATHSEAVGAVPGAGLGAGLGAGAGPGLGPKSINAPSSDGLLITTEHMMQKMVQTSAKLSSRDERASLITILESRLPAIFASKYNDNTLGFEIVKMKEFLRHYFLPLLARDAIHPDWQSEAISSSRESWIRAILPEVDSETAARLCSWLSTPRQDHSDLRTSGTLEK